MQVKQIKLSNFRNYSDIKVDLNPGKTILIGPNAQGKSNFLEAIELGSTGKSSRAKNDLDLISWSQNRLEIELYFERNGQLETLSLSYLKPTELHGLKRRLLKQIKLNGICHSSSKAILGKLVTVSFTSRNLDMLKGSPNLRRDWLDEITLRLKPTFQDIFSSYEKVVTQRNRLLKEFFEKRRLTVNDTDQLNVWDRQLATYGAKIIKQRLLILEEIMPVASNFQAVLSSGNEILTSKYVFKIPMQSKDEEAEVQGEVPLNCPQSPDVSLKGQQEEAEIATLLRRLLRERRAEEIARKQTLMGPHRDDIEFFLNDASAFSFASQGQQRSIVLSLKLAELKTIEQKIDDVPVLLLDDVMAELDVHRQRFLMSAIGHGMQTIITTTHLSSFEPTWLDGANILNVKSGKIDQSVS